MIFITFHTDHFFGQVLSSKLFARVDTVGTIFSFSFWCFCCSLGNTQQQKQQSPPFKNTRGPASALLLAKGWKVLILDSGKQERGGGVYQKWPKCDPSKQTSSTCPKMRGKKLMRIYDTVPKPTVKKSRKQKLSSLLSAQKMIVLKSYKNHFQRYC